MRTLLIGILLLFLGASCTTTVSYSGLRPADVALPLEVKSIVLLNRYKPDRRNTWINVLEGIFTGELLFVDKQGVQRALEGLQGRLVSGPKFKITIANEELYGSGTGMFPPPLSAEVIHTLCERYQADAVIALEAFDSNIAIATEPRQTKRTVNGVEVIDTYFEAFENVKITIGWRFYSNVSGTILDQHQLFASRSFSSTGATVDLARRGLLFPAEAIKQTGFEGGDSYGVRIAPSWLNYQRMIYTRAKGLGSMKNASRMAQRNDWKEAAQIWEKLSKNSESKVAKRACYNRAVAAEFMGNYDAALVWARKSADEYGFSAANTYIYALKARLSELDRLDQQMK